MYKEKYFKYKKKYLSLKSNNGDFIVKQSGGHSNPYIDFTVEKYKVIQDNLKKGIYLNKDYNGSNNKEHLEAILPKLLTASHGKINLDFINDFHKYIFVDSENTFEIERGKFRNDTNYHITGNIMGTGGGDIYFLEKNNNNNLPEKCVLKVFHDDINIKTISDYLSLEITKIYTSDYNKDKSIKNWITHKTNFTEIGKNTYDTIYNKNGDYHNLDSLLKTNTDDKFESTNDRLYLSCKNNNFYNEILINLVIAQACKDYTSKYGIINDNYVKYYNYFITKVNGNYRGCIIMEQMDGSAEKLINDIGNKIHDYKIYDTFVDLMFKEITELLLILKRKGSLFTHTDMKLENIFYKKIQVANFNKDDIGLLDNNYLIYRDKNFGYIEDNKLYFYKFYIADFDKSSITYNNVRFYNDYYTSHTTALKVYMPNIQQFKDSWLDFNYNAENKTFMIKRQLVAGVEALTAQTEVIALRYIMFPFYLSFDFQSLFISLIAHTPHIHVDNLKTMKFISELNKTIFGEGNVDRIIKIFPTYKWESITGQHDSKKYLGNFGYMITPLVQNKINLPINIMDDLRNIITPKPILGKIETHNLINTVLLTNEEHKLILSLPFIPSIEVKSVGSLWGLGRIRVTKVYTADKQKTRELYEKLQLDNIKNLFSDDETQNEILKKNYYVYYNGNQTVDTTICITNRYTYTGLNTGFYGLLYEFDYIRDSIVKQIVDLYMRDKAFSNSLQK